MTSDSGSDPEDWEELNGELRWQGILVHRYVPGTATRVVGLVPLCRDCWETESSPVHHPEERTMSMPVGPEEPVTEPIEVILHQNLVMPLDAWLRERGLALHRIGTRTDAHLDQYVVTILEGKTHEPTHRARPDH